MKVLRPVVTELESCLEDRKERLRRGLCVFQGATHLVGCLVTSCGTTRSSLGRFECRR